MDINKRIMLILKEAELYQKQGLLVEAQTRLKEVLGLVSTITDRQGAEKIIASVQKRINDIENKIKQVEKKVTSPVMTRESQDLITNMFKSSGKEDPNAAILEGAKALIKFGQFDRAVTELRKLLSVISFKNEAAKQIINCYFLESDADKAVKDYENWFSDNTFSDGELEIIKSQIQEFLRNKGLEKDHPEMFEIEKPLIPDKPETENSKIKTLPVKENSDTDEARANKKEKETFFFVEEYEEFDVLASIKRKKEPGKKK